MDVAYFAISYNMYLDSLEASYDRDIKAGLFGDLLFISLN